MCDAYPNLKAELQRTHVTISDIALHLGARPSTISQKFNGQRELRFFEAVRIKRFIQSDMSLDDLFYRVGD